MVYLHISRFSLKFLLLIFCTFFLMNSCSGMASRPEIPKVPVIEAPQYDKNDKLFNCNNKKIHSYHVPFKSINNTFKTDHLLIKASYNSSSNNNEINKIKASSPCKTGIELNIMDNYIVLNLTNNSDTLLTFYDAMIQVFDDQGNQFLLPDNLNHVTDFTLLRVNEYYEQYQNPEFNETIPKKYDQLIKLVKQRSTDENSKEIQCKNIIFGPYKDKFDSYLKTHCNLCVLEKFNPMYYFMSFSKNKYFNAAGCL